MISIVPDAVLPPAKAFPAAMGAPICCYESKTSQPAVPQDKNVCEQMSGEVYISSNSVAASVKIY